MTEYALGIINAQQAVILWQQLEKLLAPLLVEEGGLYIPVDILSMHIRGDMQIWVAWDCVSPDIDAVMVTQILRFPRKTMCAIPYIAGKNMRRWRSRFIEESEKYAKNMGATCMGGGWRRGWVKAAGYEEHGVILRKEL